MGAVNEEESSAMADRPDHAPAEGSVEYINPEQMAKSAAFAQAVAVRGPVKTVYVGLQNAVDAAGTIVGKGDIAAQTEQVLRNVQLCLEAAGAEAEHLISVNVSITHGQPIQPAFAVFQRWWGSRPNPPANSVMFIAGFLNPDLLIGIDAIAVVPLARLVVILNEHKDLAVGHADSGHRARDPSLRSG
jgi:enamine deaminase RidA (YjgF/YER057c/UK114 family)